MNNALEYLAPSFELHLRSENKSEKTVKIYLAALQHFSRWAGRAHPDLNDWPDVTRDHLRQWSVDTIATSSAGNASVHWRGLQQFLKWAELEGELAVSPMRNLSGPQPEPPTVPVIELEKLQLLLATVSGNSFVERRDNAILRLLIDTGIRRSTASTTTGRSTRPTVCAMEIPPSSPTTSPTDASTTAPATPSSYSSCRPGTATPGKA